MAKAKPTMELTTVSDREQVFLEIVDMLRKYNKAEQAYIALRAGVARTTIRNWCELRVWSPQIRTLAPIARALGYDLVLKRQRPAPPKLKIISK